MLKITNKTKLIKGFKLPRRDKKAFKKQWVGGISSITLNPTHKNISNVKEIGVSWMQALYNTYFMKKYNLTKYKGTEEIFTTKVK